MMGHDQARFNAPSSVSLILQVSSLPACPRGGCSFLRSEEEQTLLPEHRSARFLGRTLSWFGPAYPRQGSFYECLREDPPREQVHNKRYLRFLHFGHQQCCAENSICSLQGLANCSAVCALYVAGKFQVHIN